MALNNVMFCQKSKVVRKSNKFCKLKIRNQLWINNEKVNVVMRKFYRF